MMLYATGAILKMCINGQDLTIEADRPFTMPTRWAIPILIKVRQHVHALSPVSPSQGCSVTWRTPDGRTGTGPVLLVYEYRGQPWLLVQCDGRGRFVPQVDVIQVDPHPLFRTLGEAMEAAGTQAAEEMASDIARTMLGIPPESLDE